MGQWLKSFKTWFDIFRVTLTEVYSYIGVRVRGLNTPHAHVVEIQTLRTQHDNI